MQIDATRRPWRTFGTQTPVAVCSAENSIPAAVRSGVSLPSRHISPTAHAVPPTSTVVGHLRSANAQSLVILSWTRRSTPGDHRAFPVAAAKNGLPVSI